MRTREEGSTKTAERCARYDFLFQDTGEDCYYTDGEFRSMAVGNGFDNPQSAKKVNDLQALKAIVEPGAGCEIPKTEERAMTLVLLRRVEYYVRMRCVEDGWHDWTLHLEPGVPAADILEYCTTHGIALRRWDEHQASLHDVFVRMVGEEPAPARTEKEIPA